MSYNHADFTTVQSHGQPFASIATRHAVSPKWCSWAACWSRAAEDRRACWAWTAEISGGPKQILFLRCNLAGPLPGSEISRRVGLSL